MEKNIEIYNKREKCNVYDYFRENIKKDKIKDFNGDTYELVLVRYVMKEDA